MTFHFGFGRGLRAGVGCKSSAVNFLLPDISFFGGLKAKTFKVNNLQPIAHVLCTYTITISHLSHRGASTHPQASLDSLLQLLHAITAKLGGKSMTLRRSSFALSTLAGHQLDPREVLAR
jgi:hypothetical protein